MKLLTALFTSLILASTTVVASNTSFDSNENNAQCMIGDLFFDCTLKMDIVGLDAHSVVNFAGNNGWKVHRTWNDDNSRAMQIGSNKTFRVETYYRDGDELHIKPFGEVNQYDYECFKVIGSQQDFCWKKNFS